MDANIMVSAALGTYVRSLFRRYESKIEFHAPDHCFFEARRKLLEVASTRKMNPVLLIKSFEELSPIVKCVDLRDYEKYQAPALELIGKRHSVDWPVVAVSMRYGCHIWTDDQDFFGIGLPTWTTQNIEIYLKRLNS